MKTLLAQGQTLGVALKVVGLAKSSYFYQPQLRKPHPLDSRVVNALGCLTDREGVYGYRKVQKALEKKGHFFGKRTVYRHLKALGKLQPRKRKGFKRTKLPFESPLFSNVRWEADLTTTPVGVDGNAYGFAIIDCRDKEIVGEDFSQRCRAKESVNSLEKAVMNRFPEGPPEDLELILRVDRGSQYIAKAFKEAAKALKIQLAFCGVQTPNDKPYIEAFFSKYKVEEVYRNEYQNFQEGLEGWKDYLRWHNQERLHESLGYDTPEESFKALPRGYTSIVLVGDRPTGAKPEGEFERESGRILGKEEKLKSVELASSNSSTFHSRF